jgi:hypothetical protein
MRVQSRLSSFGGDAVIDLFGIKRFYGFLRLGIGGGSGGGSSTTTQEIPAELKPLASAYATKAMNLGNTGFSPYTAPRYADLNPTQNYGIGMIQDRAAGGSATMNNAETNLNQLISGGSNPYLDAQVTKAMDATKGQVMSQFGGSNYGSTANQETLGNSVGNVATQMYGNAYEGDQARRLQAISQAPTFGNQAYTDASQLLSAGQLQQNQDQNNLDFAYQQNQDQQNLPYKQLAAMSGVFGSNLGSSSSTQQDSGGK